MGDKISLKVEARELQGKKVKALRKQGLTPGVVYGADMEPLAIQADAGEVRKVVVEAGKHTPVNLTGGKRRIAMIKDIDFDPTKHGVVRHIAFHAVRADEPVTTTVAIRLIGEGESEAEKAGLVVLQALDKIEIRALPMELPEALEVSIVGLAEAGDRVTVADIELPEGVELVERDDGKAEDEDEERPKITDLMIASVWEPAALQAANEAAAGDAVDETDVEVAGTEEQVQARNEETMPGGKGQDEPK